MTALDPLAIGRALIGYPEDRHAEVCRLRRQAGRCEECGIVRDSLAVCPFGRFPSRCARYAESARRRIQRKEITNGS